MNKFKFIFIFILFILLLSCNNKNKYTKKINNNERFEYFKKNSDSTYSKKIYKFISDTLNKWINLNIEYWAFNDTTYSVTKWKLSQNIYFNSTKDKLVARIPLQAICESCVMDRIYTIIGQKIDSVWWFYTGESYALLREWYTKEIHKPLTFEKLEEIGINETMNWYYFEKDSTFCNLVNHSDLSFNNHNCKKVFLILNDIHYSNINWECEHESYVIDFYDKKIKQKRNNNTNL